MALLYLDLITETISNFKHQNDYFVLSRKGHSNLCIRRSVSTTNDLDELRSYRKVSDLGGECSIKLFVLFIYENT